MNPELTNFPSGECQTEPSPVTQLSAETLIQNGSSGVKAAGDGSLTCRIYGDMEQGSDEWLSARMGIFTASEVGLFLMEEPKCTLSVDELKEKLTALKIAFTSKDKKSDLERKYPHLSAFMGYTKETIESRQNLIDQKMELHTTEGKALAAEENRKLAFNWDIKRGNEQEPEAREVYASLTGDDVTQVGLCVHHSSIFDAAGFPVSGFGCSPDGLIQNGEIWTHGLELKCVRPKTLLGWLREDALPRKHAAQVHMSMAVTGLRRWNFMGYAREVPPLIVEVSWNSTTDRMLESLHKLHSDFRENWERVGQITVKRIKL